MYIHSMYNMYSCVSILVYAYLGPDSGKTADLKHEFTGSSTVRTWEIKVSQIECGATSL